MKFNSILIVILLLSVSACSTKQAEDFHGPVADNYALTPYLIPAEKLVNASSDNIVLVDFRKKGAYEAGHLASAVHMWRPMIADTAYPYGGMRATKEQLELVFRECGVNTGDTIVVYDDNGGVDALRLIWLLQYYGYEACCLLDGGIQAASKAGMKLSRAKPHTQPGNFSLGNTNNELLLSTKEDILEALNADNVVIIDARNEEEYSGKRMKKGAFRAGHIPGSVLIDFYHNIDYSTMKLKPAEELRAFYESMGIVPEKEILVYCQSGVRSAQTSFVLRELLKYPIVKNYDGSWIEWSYFKELPIESDSTTSIFE